MDGRSAETADLCCGDDRQGDSERARSASSDFGESLISREVMDAIFSLLLCVAVSLATFIFIWAIFGVYVLVSKVRRRFHRPYSLRCAN